MISAEEALKIILESVSPLKSERISILRSVGRVLTEDVRAREDLPSFDNSAMDGYAVLAKNVYGANKGSPVRLNVPCVIKAGESKLKKLSAGQAIKVMTGAVLPQGADAVVMKEMVSETENGTVQIYHTPKPGENIRFRGEDVRAGGPLLKNGTLIRPFEVALFAAQGIKEISVVRKVKAAVFSTGDELISYSKSITYGRIRNSNGPAVSSALARWGVEVKDGGITADRPRSIENKLRKLLKSSNLVIASGGVSVGDFDFTKGIFEKIGAKELFWKAAIKPGKPLWFGLYKNKPVFGLPGNPVSALVCLEEFIRPAIEKMGGYRIPYPSYHLRGKALNDYIKDPNKKQYAFCVAQEDKGQFSLNIIRPQGSAMVGMAVRANALAVLPQGVSRVCPGDALSFRWLK